MLDSFFHLHPVFRYEEFALWKEGLYSRTSPRALRKALYYHTKAGHLINVRRGVYAVVPPSESPDEIAVDPYLLAAKASKDSVLAYHTALEMHGVAYSVFEQFTFLTTQKIKPFHFRGQQFQPVARPLALTKSSDPKYGIEMVNRQGLEIAVTNLARTFVDVLDRIELSGGWEEVVRSISNMAVLDVNVVVRYCLMLNNRILAAKVGYFLEQRQGAFIVSEEILQPLLEKKPLTPQSLVGQQQGQGQFVKKWNLILPLRILKKSWEEPNEDV